MDEPLGEELTKVSKYYLKIKIAECNRLLQVFFVEITIWYLLTL